MDADPDHLGLGEAFAAVRPEPPGGQPVLGAAQLVVGQIGELAPMADLPGKRLGTTTLSTTWQDHRPKARREG